MPKGKVVAKEKPNPGGAPPDIFHVVDTMEDGTEVTVADRIVALVRTGMYLEPAIAAAGSTKPTAYGWLRIAGKLRIAWGGKPAVSKLTKFEQACLRFSDAVVEAESNWEAVTLATLERVGRGGIPIEKTTVKTERRETVVDGEVRVEWVETERTVVRTTMPPNPQVLEWRLSRRFPERYREHVEITANPGKLTVEERAEELIKAIDMIVDEDGVAVAELESGE